MFRGIHTISIDAKGRFTVPTRYREELGQKIVLTIDTEETCLLMYRTEEWQDIENNLQRLPSFNPAARRIQRLLIGHATDLELDSNARVILPAELRDYAHLDKHIKLVGQGNKFEIWDEARWHERREQWLLEESSRSNELPDEMKTFSL